MSKLPPELEHPVDTALVGLSKAALPLWRSLDFVPNHVTFLSMGCEAAALWFLTRDRPAEFAVTAALGVFFDYADGHYARTDDMVTRLGDLLDHGSDWTYALAATVLVTMKTRSVVPLCILTVLGLAMAVHLGCQQRVHVSQAPETLDALRCMCTGDPRLKMRITRWVGSVAVFHTALIALGIWSMQK